MRAAGRATSGAAKGVVAWAVLACLAWPTGAAARTPAETVDAFYEALRRADADALRSILADDATVRLADLGFTMSAEEFVESMDVWTDVARDMTMRVRPDPDAPAERGTVVRLVCYEFPSNTSYTRETSRVSGDRVVSNDQEEIGEACEGF